MSAYTIVIVNYKTWRHLRKCLIALSKQTFRDFSVNIVNNDRDHPAPESILKINPSTRLIQNTYNRGFAGANNQAFAHATQSDWFILINPDAFLKSDCIAKLIKAADNYPEYSILGSRLLVDPKTNRIDGNGDRYHISGLAWRDRIPRNDFGKRAPYEVFSACAAAVMIKSDIIKKYGGFDEDFFCYMEDVDLGFRMRLYGQRCMLVPDAIAYHVGSASSGGQHSNFAVYYGHRNLVWTYVKNMPGLSFWFFLPLHCAINLLAIVWFSLKGQGRTIIQAKRDALKGLPKMWRKRKWIQPQRRVAVASILRAMDKRLFPLRR